MTASIQPPPQFKRVSSASDKDVNDYLDGRKKRKGSPSLRHLKKETGWGKDAMVEVKNLHFGNPLRQVSEFFDRFRIPAATGRKRNASMATEDAYRARMEATVNKLREMNMSIRNLDEMTARQIKLLFRAEEAKGASASWMANLNTTVRRFGIWLGKPDLCPPLAELLLEPWSAQRKYSATVPKTWGASGHDEEEAIARVGAECPVTGMQLRLAKVFGVRVQEFLMFKPAELEIAGHIYVRDGTKGGRPRNVPIETEEQRALLDEATEIAAQHPRGLLVAKPGLSLKQALSRFYNTLSKVGITRKEMGITTHGLRHGYACRIYKLLTGQDAPVQGGGYVEPELDKKARMEIAKRLGHSRIYIVSAYIGSQVTMSRMAKENINHLVSVLEGDVVMKELASNVGLEQVCVLGPVADGQPIGKGGTLTLGYRSTVKEGQSQLAADAAALAGADELASRAGILMGCLSTTKRLSAVPSDTSTLDLIGLSASGYPVKPESTVNKGGRPRKKTPEELEAAIQAELQAERDGARLA
jgi:integrase